MSDPRQVNINEKNIVELKAMAYDILVKREPLMNSLNAMNSDLRVIQQEIQQRYQEEALPVQQA